MDNNEKIITENLDKLQKLAGERDAIESHMGRLHLAVRSLCPLVEDRIQREAYMAMVDKYRVRIGLTDLIHRCFDMFDGPLTANEIRAFIINYGSDHILQPNLLQSIYTTLTRLRKANEIKVVKKQGEKAFKKISLGERLAQKTTKKDAAKAATVVGDAFEARFSFPKFELPDLRIQTSEAMQQYMEEMRKLASFQEGTRNKILDEIANEQNNFQKAFAEALKSVSPTAKLQEALESFPKEKLTELATRRDRAVQIMGEVRERRDKEKK
jgi:hypothetical protein